MARKKKEIVNEVISAETMEEKVSEILTPMENEIATDVKEPLIANINDFVEKTNVDEICVMPIADEKITDENTDKQPIVLVKNTKETNKTIQKKTEVNKQDKNKQKVQPKNNIRLDFTYFWNGTYMD